MESILGAPEGCQSSRIPAELVPETFHLIGLQFRSASPALQYINYWRVEQQLMAVVRVQLLLQMEPGNYLNTAATVSSGENLPNENNPSQTLGSKCIHLYSGRNSHEIGGKQKHTGTWCQPPHQSHLRRIDMAAQFHAYCTST